MHYTRPLTPALSHRMGDGARRAGEGWPVVYPTACTVSAIHSSDSSP